MTQVGRAWQLSKGFISMMTTISQAAGHRPAPQPSCLWMGLVKDLLW